MKLTHKFTHLHWVIHVHKSENILEHENYFLMPIENLKDITIVTAHRKILQKLGYIKG